MPCHRAKGDQRLMIRYLGDKRGPSHCYMYVAGPSLQASFVFPHLIGRLAGEGQFDKWQMQVLERGRLEISRDSSSGSRQIWGLAAA
jgi:hypothetical protein